MLSHEWRELEVLCDRIADMRERLATARKSGNPGLMDSLKADIAAAQRQREALVQHISARLGSVAATSHQHKRASAKPHPKPAVPDVRDPALSSDS